MKEEGLPTPRLALAEMSDFSLDTTVDGAFCAINTIQHLSSFDQAKAHLTSVHRHLPKGSRYLVQLGLQDLSGDWAPNEASSAEWKVTSDVGTIHCRWSV